MPSQYTGNPTATQSPASAPGDAVDVILNLPVDGDTPNASSVYQMVKVLADWTAWFRDNRKTVFDTTASGITASGTGAGSISYHNSQTLTSGATTRKTVRFTVSITLTAGAAVIGIALASPHAFATGAETVQATIALWSGGAPAGPALYARATAANQLEIGIGGMGTCTGCTIAVTVEGR